MRSTPVRQTILEFLATQRVPVSLNTVATAEAIRGRCNATTVYRTLMLFCEIEVLRQVGLPDKTSFFVLNVPGESHHFLICRMCGIITELPPGDHCASFAQDVTAAHGYVQLHHELQFFGICPVCQEKPGRTICAKLPVRRKTP